MNYVLFVHFIISFIFFNLIFQTVESQIMHKLLTALKFLKNKIYK